MDYPTIPFERTSCDCTVCKVGCRTMPGSLIPGDLEKICEHTDHEMGGDWVLSNFVASDGAKVGMRKDDGTMELFEVPTIVPRQREDGSCVFLDDDHRCTIHGVAPFGCAYHDMHMGAEEGKERSHYGVMAQVAGHQPEQQYGALWFVLNMFEQLATPMRERKQAFEEETDRVERQTG